MTTEQFTQPRADRDADLVAYDQLSRENAALREWQQDVCESLYLEVEHADLATNLIDDLRAEQR